MVISLILIFSIMMFGCGHIKAYPIFPIPSPHVAKILDEVGTKDKEVWEWLNKLLDLCQQLGTCEEEK